MSAQTDHTDLLRRAAAKARETAEAAPRGPYTFKLTPGYHQPIYADDGDVIGTTRPWAGGIADDTGSAEQTAAHITLWHPGVALAVAAWLDTCAAAASEWWNSAPPGATARDPELHQESFASMYHYPLAVARALLGEDTR